VVTRRVSDAWQTVRAWIWNLWHLRETLRLRRAVQGARLRTDAELQPLFAKVTTRLRAYAEAIGDWVAGGEVEFDTAPMPEETDEPATATARLVALVRRRPVTSSAVVLLVLGIAIALPLLRGGTIRGGDLAPWPAHASTFLSSYVSSWHAVGGFGTAAPPSPAQAVLGVIGYLAAGSAWLAPRLLLLGAVPAAWVLGLRAGRAVTPRRLPRLVAATAYALSPPMLAALRAGRIGTLVVGVALPALVVTLTTVLRPSAPAATAWRNTAAGAIVAAVMVAFEPVTALGLVAGLLVALAVAAAGPARAGRRVVIRLLGFAIATFLLLFPWSVSLLRPGSPVFDALTPTALQPQPFWRWLLLAPELAGFPGLLAGVGLLVAGVLGIAFGAPARPRLAAGLWIVAVLGAFGAWALARAGEGAWAWAGLPALLTAISFAGLLALAFAAAAPQLETHDFGWRHLASGVTATVVAVGLAASVVTVTRAPWEGYALADTPLPSFIAAEAETTGPFRVLVLADDGETVAWDLAGAEGPTMASFGVPRPDALVDHVQEVVDDVLGGSDPGAAGRLGVANVRYVVVPQTGRTERLERALGEQLGLEPQPVAEGRLLPGRRVAAAGRGGGPLHRADRRTARRDAVGRDRHRARPQRPHALRGRRGRTAGRHRPDRRAGRRWLGGRR
jgi:hypothetical protein